MCASNNVHVYDARNYMQQECTMQFAFGITFKNSLIIHKEKTKEINV